MADWTSENLPDELVQFIYDYMGESETLARKARTAMAATLTEMDFILKVERIRAGLKEYRAKGLQYRY